MIASLRSQALAELRKRCNRWCFFVGTFIDISRQTCKFQTDNANRSTEFCYNGKQVFHSMASATFIISSSTQTNSRRKIPERPRGDLITTISVLRWACVDSFPFIDKSNGFHGAGKYLTYRKHGILSRQAKVSLFRMSPSDISICKQKKRVLKLTSVQLKLRYISVKNVILFCLVPRISMKEMRISCYTLGTQKKRK